MKTINHLSKTIYIFTQPNNLDQCIDRSYIIEQVSDGYYFVYFKKDNIAVQLNDFYDLESAVEYVKMRIDSTFSL